MITKKGWYKFMLVSPLENMKHERAVRAREIEYLKESVRDSEIDDRMIAAEELYVRESVEDYEEAKEELKVLSEKEDVSMTNEVNRLLNADHDLTFNEMIGIE